MGVLSVIFRRLLRLFLGSGRTEASSPSSPEGDDATDPNPTPLIFESELDRIREETRAARTNGVETGGVLFGTRTPDDELLIYRATGPGPNAEHHAAEFSPDTDHAQQLLDRLRREKDVVWVGTWHKHPAEMNSLSGGDVAQMREFVEDPDLLDEMVAIIVTNQGSDVRVNGFHMDEGLSPVRTGIDTVPEDEEDRYRNYCRYDDREGAAQESPSSSDLSATSTDRSSEDMRDAPIEDPSEEQSAEAANDTQHASSARAPETQSSGERERDSVEADQPETLKSRVVEEYESLQTIEAVREVTLRRNDTDEGRSFLIRVVPRDTTPLVFVCSDEFPADPPVVARESADRYEPLEQFPAEWSSHRSLTDVLTRILDDGSGGPKA